MLPTIRRTRRPLTEPEAATIVPTTAIRSDFGQFRSDSTESAHPEKPSAIQPPTDTDHKHLSLGSEPLAGTSKPLAPDDQPSTISPSATATINNQPSGNPWSLQPGEPAGDYHAFATWLQLPAPRTFRKAAAALQCTVQRLRRLAAHRDWRFRADAFDNRRASATSKALDQLLNDEILDLKQRAEHFRLQEWLLHEEMLEAARAAAQELKSHPRRVSITELARLFDLASTLGRRATGLPLDLPSEAIPPPPNLEVEAALKKIYGRPEETRSADFPVRGNAKNDDRGQNEHNSI